MHCAITTTDDVLAYHGRHSTNSSPGTLASFCDALLDRMIALFQGINQNDPSALDEALSLTKTHPRLRVPKGDAVPRWAPELAWGLAI